MKTCLAVTCILRHGKDLFSAMQPSDVKFYCKKSHSRLDSIVVLFDKFVLELIRYLVPALYPHPDQTLGMIGER